ncbi:MAG: hypothetical protein VKN33_10305 [Candidatus Sericytochromatia bacterium]|nr:hypothetical protein [Candidatus Sericytochromatia bacterium]
MAPHQQGAFALEHDEHDSAPDELSPRPLSLGPWMYLFVFLTGLGLAAAASLSEHYLASLSVGFETVEPLFLSLLALAVAVGVFAGHKVVRRVLHPLYLYAWLCLVTALCLPLMPTVQAHLVTGNLSDMHSAMWIQLILGCFPSAGAIGFMWPVLSHLMEQRMSRHWNWAFIGTMLGGASGHWLFQTSIVPSWGPERATYLLSFVWVIAGIFAMGLSKQDSAPQAEEDSPPGHPISPPQMNRLLLVTTSLGLGVASVAWHRLFAVAWEGGIYIPAVATTAILGSLALGAGLFTIISHRKNLTASIAVMASLGAIFFVSTFLIDRVALWLSHASRMLLDAPDAFPVVLVLMLVIATLCVVPAGICFASAWNVAEGDDARIPKTWLLPSAVFAWALGHFLGWYGVLPILGIKGLFQGLGAYFACLAALMTRQIPGWSTLRVISIASLPLFALGLLRAVNPYIDLPAMALSRSFPPPPSWIAVKSQLGGGVDPIFSRSDSHGNVALYATRVGLDLILDGHAISLPNDTVAHRVAGHLPLLLQTTPGAIALVGSGDGVMAASILKHNPQRLDVYEPNDAAWAATRKLQEFNQGALEDPRTHRLASPPSLKSDTRYQAIIFPARCLKPQALSRIPTLLTYQRWIRHLSPGGIFVQEVDLEGQDISSFQHLAAQLSAHLAHLTLWQTEGTRVLLMGTRAHLKIQSSSLQKKLRAPSIADDLKKIGLDAPEALLMLQMGTEQSVASWAYDSQNSRHAHTTLEFLLPKLAYAGRTCLVPYEQDVRLSTGSGADPQHALTQYRKQTATDISAGTFAKFVVYQKKHLPLNEHRGLAGKVIREWRSQYPQDRHARLAEANRLARKGHVVEALTCLEQSPRPFQSREERLLEANLLFTQVVGGHGWMTAQPAGLARALRTWHEIANEKSNIQLDAWKRLMTLHHIAGDLTGEYAAAKAALAILSRDSHPRTIDEKINILVNIGETALNSGDIPKALGYCLEALRLDPADPSARRLRSRIVETESLER